MDWQRRCLGCGYSLRGLPQPVCPECGRGFDPDDPETHVTPARWAQTLLRRMLLGYRSTIVGMGAAVILLEITSVGPWSHGHTILAATAMVLVVAPFGWMLTHLYRVGRFVFGHGYAVRQVLLVVLLLPVFLLGLIAIPMLVASDVRAALRE